MAFADSFATCMSNAGIPVEAGGIPDAATLGPVIDYLKSFVQNLDPDVRDGLDAATADDLVSVALADAEVGAIDHSYVGLLHAFDNAAGFPLSLCLQWCDHCLAEANSSASTT